MDYEKLCIYELRKLAREIGVKSPTSLKRAQLLEKIKAIESGIEQPYIKKSNKGRPVKQLNFDISRTTFEIKFLNFLLDIKEKNIKENKRIDDFLNKLNK